MLGFAFVFVKPQNRKKCLTNVRNFLNSMRFLFPVIEEFSTLLRKCVNPKNDGVVFPFELMNISFNKISFKSNFFQIDKLHHNLSLIHISEPTRLLSISYAVF